MFLLNIFRLASVFFLQFFGFFKYSNIQRFKDSKIQIFKDSNIQRFKYSRIQIFKNSNIQRFKYSRIQIFKDSKIRRFKYSRIQRFKDSNIQRFENFTFLSLIRKRLGLIKFNPNKNRMISVGIFVLNMCSNIDCLYKWSESEKYALQTRRDGWIFWRSFKKVILMYVV